MTTRVYQFRCYPPTAGADIVRAQLRAGHDYANDLVAIERGRRAAIRAIDDASSVVQEALATVKASTRSTRRDAVRTLYRARRDVRAETRCDGGHWAAPADEYPYSPLYETERIALLDASIRRHARALTTAHWGTYLVAEAAAQARRKPSKNSPDPCYEPDAVTPCDPRFRRFAPPHPSHHGSGCVAVQLQGGISTRDALACRDSQARLHVAGPITSQHRKDELSIRVGSAGRNPVWATFPVRVGRAIPDDGVWKWVRVTCRHDGLREWWTCEITVETKMPAQGPDAANTATLAVEVAWDKPDDDLNIAYWRDDAGQSGTIALPPRIPAALRKASDIQSIRDTTRADLAKRLARAILESTDAPRWLFDEARTMHLWQSCGRFHRLVHRWRSERCDAARPAYEMLDSWWERDCHLWEYESGARSGALRARLDFYRTLARSWERQYASVLLDDRNLAREARWGEASELRFLAGPSELRGAIEHAFGLSRVNECSYRPEDEEDDRGFCERAIDAKSMGVARASKKANRIAHGDGGAWAARKAKARAPKLDSGTAREATSKATE
jgi:hypothetical protein